MVIVRISLACSLILLGVLMMSEISMETAVFRSFIFFTGFAAILMVGKSMINIVRPGIFRRAESKKEEDDDE